MDSDMIYSLPSDALLYIHWDNHLRNEFPHYVDWLAQCGCALQNTGVGRWDAVFNSMDDYLCMKLVYGC